MTLIFIPKLLEYLRRQRNKSGTSVNNIVADNRSSRDDEEQYQRLDRENRDLADKIKEKDFQIQTIIRRIDAAQEQANLAERTALRERRINKRVVRISEPQSDEHDQSDTYQRNNSSANRSVNHHHSLDSGGSTTQLKDGNGTINCNNNNVNNRVSSYIDPLSDSGLGTSKKCSDIDLSHL